MNEAAEVLDEVDVPPGHTSCVHRCLTTKLRGRKERQLTTRESDVLRVVMDYFKGTREACPSRYVARQLEMHHSTVLQHYLNLHEKGQLNGAGSPAIPTHLQQRLAHEAVHQAVFHGRLQKPQACSGCGAASERAALHGHHRDYSKPLDVIWLCGRCHRREHSAR